MKMRRSRPSASIPMGNDAPSNPRLRSERKNRWTATEYSFEGRNTKSPLRTTAPAFATPPARCLSSTASVCLRVDGDRAAGFLRVTGRAFRRGGDRWRRGLLPHVGHGHRVVERQSESLRRNWTAMLALADSGHHGLQLIASHIRTRSPPVIAASESPGQQRRHVRAIDAGSVRAELPLGVIDIRHHGWHCGCRPNARTERP
jgi:hypothetical protein